MNISNLIKSRRKELNLSSTEVADKLHISRATYYRYEKAVEKIPSSMIAPLSSILKLTPAMLLGIDSLENSLTQIEQLLDEVEVNAETETYIEQLAESVGYTLIKDYTTSVDNKNISAIIHKDNISLISEEEYNRIINSVKDFTSFKLNSIYKLHQNK